MDEARIARLLVPFGLELSAHQAEQVMAYLDLLMRWNKKINLTAIRNADDCVTKHFGESMFLSRFVELSGGLLDVGSGAGFPGLALKVAFPSLAVTLLEPVAKKRAFLKEVARVCSMDSVEVRGERLEDFLSGMPVARFDTVTARAVGQLDSLVPEAARCLAAGGRLALWLSHRQSVTLLRETSTLSWADPIQVPLGHESEILVGTLKV